MSALELQPISETATAQFDQNTAKLEANEDNFLLADIRGDCSVVGEWQRLEWLDKDHNHREQYYYPE